MKNNNWLFQAGALLVLTGAVMQIARFYYAPYVTAVGGILVFIFRVAFTPKSNDFRIRRLMKFQLIGSFLLLVGAYLMYINNNAWALSLFLAAFLDVFIMWRMPKEDDK